MGAATGEELTNPRHLLAASKLDTHLSNLHSAVEQNKQNSTVSERGHEHSDEIDEEYLTIGE